MQVVARNSVEGNVDKFALLCGDLEETKEKVVIVFNFVILISMLGITKGNIALTSSTPFTS